MTKATSLRILLPTLALLALAAGPVRAEVISEAAIFDGRVLAGEAVGAGARPVKNEATTVITDIYNNTASAPVAGISSTDLNSVWGDRLFTLSPGIVEQQAITVFNSGTSAGPLLTATVQVRYYDGVSNALLGGFDGTINFGAGLNPGFFSIATFTNMGSLPTPVNLTTQNVIITQQVAGFTGPATRLGVAFLDPVTVGASPPEFYAQSLTIGGGVPGFYALSFPANPGYRIAIDTTPVSTEPGSWGAIKALYR